MGSYFSALKMISWTVVLRPRQEDHLENYYNKQGLGEGVVWMRVAKMEIMKTGQISWLDKVYEEETRTT